MDFCTTHEGQHSLASALPKHETLSQENHLGYELIPGQN